MYKVVCRNKVNDEYEDIRVFEDKKSANELAILMNNKNEINFIFFVEEVNDNGME